MRQGEKYTAQEYGETCLNLDISQEYTAAATPQQIGVSEWDGRNLTVIVRTLLKDSNLTKSLWGEIFFITKHLFNRAPHSALGGKTPYVMMHGKEGDISMLRAIGDRAFVHNEHYKMNFDDRSWEGKHRDYVWDSKNYNHPATHKVVESRNVDNAQNSSKAEPEAQEEISDLVRKAQRYNARLQTQRWGCWSGIG